MQARASVLVQAPADRAFAFIADPANDLQWRSHLVSSRGAISAPGDRVVQTYSHGGRSKTVDLTVAEYDPPHRLTLALTEPARARLSFTCRPDSGGTRVSASISATLSGPLALFESRAQAELEKVLHADLDRLKAALDGR